MNTPRGLVFRVTTISLLSLVLLSPYAKRSQAATVTHQQDTNTLAPKQDQDFELTLFNYALQTYVDSEKIEALYTSYGMTDEAAGNAHLITFKTFYWMCEDYLKLTSLTKDRAQLEAAKIVTQNTDWAATAHPTAKKRIEKTGKIAKTRYTAVLENLNASCKSY